MGDHPKDASRVTVINRNDGLHISEIFIKLVTAFKLTLDEANSLVKSYSDAIHEGKNSSTKAKSNTSSNLLGLFRSSLLKKSISWCNLITLFRVMRFDNIEITITATRGDEKQTISHEITLKESKPKSDLW